MNMKKAVTLGLYLSVDWNNSGCELEIWNGDRVTEREPKLHTVDAKVAPVFNRMVMFLCNDRAWHGNPTPICDDQCTRIFLTMSYMCENEEDVLKFNLQNTHKRARFIELPNEVCSEEKKEMIRKRADNDLCNTVYRKI